MSDEVRRIDPAPFGWRDRTSAIYRLHAKRIAPGAGGIGRRVGVQTGANTLARQRQGLQPDDDGDAVAFAVFFVLLFPVGKAMTFAFGSKIELGGTVASYHRSPSVRRSWHGCRGKNLVSLSNGKTVEVCGMELPRGMPVRLSMMSSALGRYSEQLASQTDLAGIGSLDGIVGQADRATEEADRAVQAARRTIGE